MFAFTATAQKFSSKTSDEIKSVEEIPTISDHKISPDLDEKSNEQFYGLRGDETQKVIIRLKSETNLSEINADSLNPSEQKRVFAAEFAGNKSKTGILMSELQTVGGRIKKSFNNLGLVSAELPLSQIRELVKSENVAYVSADSEIQSFGHVSNTTGWTNPGIADAGDSNSTTWLGGGREVSL